MRWLSGHGGCGGHNRRPGGSFSRMDALLLLLWLLCAVYRAAMLCAAIRLLWQQPEAEVQL